MEVENKRPRFSRSSIDHESSISKLAALYEPLKGLKAAEIVEQNGQFIRLMLYNTTSDEERAKKKLMIMEILPKFLDRRIDLPAVIHDSLIGLYDSVNDLELLVIARLVVNDFQMPKQLQQEIVSLIEGSNGGLASDKLQLLATSAAIERAVLVIPREVTKLLLYSSGVLVKPKQEAHAAALYCLRAFLNRVQDGDKENNPETFSGSDLVQKFCQKILKHRPTPMSKECVSFLLGASVPAHAHILRDLFRDDSVTDILQATAVKYPEEFFAILGNVYSLSSADTIPLENLSSIVENVIACRESSETLITIIKFTLSCREAALILRKLFSKESNEGNEDGSESPRLSPLVDLFQTFKIENDLRAVWPAAALRFLNSPAVVESLRDGSMEQIIESALNSPNEKTAALLLLCPHLDKCRFRDGTTFRLDVDSSQGDCVNCAVSRDRIAAHEAAQEALAKSVVSLQLKIFEQKDELSKMRNKIVASNALVHQRDDESASLQSQVALRERNIQELKESAKAAQSELEDQKSKNQETMTALKQARRDGEKLRGELDKKRGENKSLVRELAQSKEQLIGYKKKIEELQCFKERLNSLMGSLP